ncbi:unnamed protein product [Amaranthus hypochondriacus]
MLVKLTPIATILAVDIVAVVFMDMRVTLILVPDAQILMNVRTQAIVALIFAPTIQVTTTAHVLMDTMVMV